MTNSSKRSTSTKSLKCKPWKRVSAKTHRSMKKQLDQCITKGKADEACLVQNRLCSLRRELSNHPRLTLKHSKKSCRRKPQGTYSVKQRRTLLKTCVKDNGVVRDSCLRKKGLCLIRNKLKETGSIALRSRTIKK